MDLTGASTIKAIETVRIGRTPIPVRKKTSSTNITRATAKVNGKPQLSTRKHESQENVNLSNQLKLAIGHQKWKWKPSIKVPRRSIKRTYLNLSLLTRSVKGSYFLWPERCRTERSMQNISPRIEDSSVWATTAAEARTAKKILLSLRNLAGLSSRWCRWEPPTWLSLPPLPVPPSHSSEWLEFRSSTDFLSA